MYSPLLLSDDYSGLSEKEKEIAEYAVRFADIEYGYVQRTVVERVSIHDLSWKVEFTVYGFFNIPLTDCVVESEGSLTHFSFRDTVTFTPLVGWLSIFSPLYLPIVLLVYYLFRQR